MFEPKIVFEAVSDEDDADVGQVPQLLVGILQCCQVFLADMRVQIARLDTGELGQIVDDLLLCGNVVIDERYTFLSALSGGRMQLNLKNMSLHICP